jgi:multisubunit Na+/H+ antiporter MnhC subunit
VDCSGGNPRRRNRCLFGVDLVAARNYKKDMSTTRQVLDDPVLLGLILTAIAINLAVLGLKLERRRAHQVTD